MKLVLALTIALMGTFAQADDMSSFLERAVGEYQLVKSSAKDCSQNVTVSLSLYFDNSLEVETQSALYEIRNINKPAESSDAMGGLVSDKSKTTMKDQLLKSEVKSCTFLGCNLSYKMEINVRNETKKLEIRTSTGTCNYAN